MKILKKILKIFYYVLVLVKQISLLVFVVMVVHQFKIR